MAALKWGLVIGCVLAGGNVVTAGEAKTITSQSKYGEFPVLTFTGHREVSPGISVGSCKIFKNRVEINFVSGSYRLYTRKLPVQLEEKTLQTIGKLRGEKHFDANQKRAKGKANVYWASSKDGIVPDIALEFHKKSAYAVRLMRILDHLCR